MGTLLKRGRLKLLEPSGPVQACNGIDLPLHLRLLQVNCARRCSRYGSRSSQIITLKREVCPNAYRNDFLGNAQISVICVEPIRVCVKLEVCIP
jgi:hypothetical protein